MLKHTGKQQVHKGVMIHEQMEKAASLALCLGLLFGTAAHAQEISPTDIDYSAVFDAEYYYKQ